MQTGREAREGVVTSVTLNGRHTPIPTTLTFFFFRAKIVICVCMYVYLRRKDVEWR
jgi:hypothetical protein